MKSKRFFFRCVLSLATLMLMLRNGYSQDWYVTVHSGHFSIAGHPYQYVGTNYWYGGILALSGEKGKERLCRELDFLKRNGITNLRVMAGVEGISDYPYHISFVAQPEEGKYDEKTIEGLDYFLNEARKRNNQFNKLTHY